MAKKPTSENYDVLSSIFDFIFSEADKPAPLRRSVKPPKSGMPGDSALTDAIFATLEKPGTFVSSTVINEFNGALDIKLAEVEFQEMGGIKFTSSGLVDLLRNPAAYVEAQIKKNKGIRSTSRARFMGAVMEDFIATAWAQKYGNQEVKNVMRATATANEIEREKYRTSRALGQYLSTHTEDKPSVVLENKIPGRRYEPDLDYMADRSLELLGRKTFGASWQTMNANDKLEFSKITVGNSSVVDIQRYLVREYSPQEARQFERAVSRVYTKPADKVDVFSAQLYKSLEKDNLVGKINALRNAPAGSPQEDEKRLYEKTLYLLNMEKDNLLSQLDELKTELGRTTDPVRKKELKEQIKETRNAYKVLTGHTLIGQVGKWEGYFNSINGVYGGLTGTNVVASMLDGSFFDPNRNQILNPVEEKKGVAGGDKIYVAKDSKRRLMKDYNKIGTTLYYLTPRSLFKTLFYNGEGFAYLFHNRLGAIKDLALEAPNGRLRDAGAVLLSDFISELNNRPVRELDSFVSAELARLSVSGLFTSQQLTKLKALTKTAERFRKLVYGFSIPFRAKRYITEYLDKRIFKRIRVSIGRKLVSSRALQDLFKRTGAAKFLGAWITKGGFGMLLRGIATAIAGAIGLAGTPIASFIVTAITWVLTDLAMKALGLGLNIAKYFILGLIAILLLVFTIANGAVTEFNKINYASSQTIPGTVVSCTQYEEQELDTGWDDEWGDPTVAPPPSGEKCILGTQPIYCSQGYEDVTGWSHQNIQSRLPVDLTNIEDWRVNAPQFCEVSKGNCTVTRIAMIDCWGLSNAGGIVEYDANDGSTVHHFKLLHVVPYELISVGTKLDKGQGVAQIQTNLEDGPCWTGPHLHLETTQNGSPVDPLELLQEFGCNVPDEAGCADSY